MDLRELKQEQLRLAPKIILRDSFTKVKTIGAAACVSCGKDLIACVVVCGFPALTLKEKKTFLLPDPLTYVPSYEAYREMPAIIEAFNRLEEEPDILLVNGPGINHPCRFGLAAHLGLALQKPTIGVGEKVSLGTVQQGKIMFNGELLGFEVLTREYANPLFVSPGNLISLGSVLDIVRKCLKYPHKFPEPLHLAQKLAKKEVGRILEKSKPQP
ncbi:endonuclease V [Candidatus Woesearchaeota archaeon]|nr:endonuclease V [Candidatus Woesearchaeota archaeon]